MARRRKFLLDENLSPTLKRLFSKGAKSVFELDLDGMPDPALFKLVRDKSAILVTNDTRMLGRYLRNAKAGKHDYCPWGLILIRQNTVEAQKRLLRQIKDPQYNWQRVADKNLGLIVRQHETAEVNLCGHLDWDQRPHKRS